MSAPSQTIHATCVLLGEAGVLIRGVSGSGKSTLARALVECVAAEGRFARLVCDDRVTLAVCGGRLVARAVPAIAGKLEIRGLGLMDVPWEPAAVVRLVVTCGEALPRRPEPEDLRTTLLGQELPSIAVPAGLDSTGLIRWRMRALDDTAVTGC